MTGIVWTINAITFASLCLIWKRDDLMNFSFKVIFLGLAVINAAPAWQFLQKAF